MWWLVYTVCIAVEPGRVECQREAAYPRPSVVECRKLHGPMAEYLNDLIADNKLRVVYLGMECQRGQDL